MKVRARRDLLFFINQFLWTYDPRPEAPPHHLPFITWDYQDDYIRWINGKIEAVEDSLTDKSRDMGVTWLVLAVILWHWLFDVAFNALLGSRKELLVDNYQLDSLFGKLGYMIERLPSWMLPEGFNIEEHRTHMRIVNPESGNTIQGESANPEFSRQGRYTLIFLDEFAFWPWAASVWTATADSAPIRIVVSTPYGRNNKFAELRFGKDISVRSLHWTLHPRKDDAWYEAEKSRRTTREIAQELDMDYEASGNERVFSILRTNVKLRSNVVIKPIDIPFEEERTRTGRLINGVEEVLVKRHYVWRLDGGFDYGTRATASFHVYARTKAGKHYAIWEWRRTLGELRAKGWRGSMVQAATSMLLNDCPYYNNLGLVWSDPSLWAQNVSTPDGMTSLYAQFVDEGITKLAKGAQSDRAAIERTLSLWADPEDPDFMIFDTCPGLIDDFDGLEWDDWSEVQAVKKNLKETIVDKDNHSWDDWKYYIRSKPAAPAERKAAPPETSAEWFKRRIEDTKRQTKRGVKLRRF